MKNDEFETWFLREFGGTPHDPRGADVWRIQYAAAASAYLRGILDGRKAHAATAREICSVAEGGS